MKKVTFKHWDCIVKKGRYMNSGPIWLSLEDEVDGEPVARCTISLPGVTNKDEVAIKDYSENEGMLDTLMDAGVVKPPHRFVSSGFVMIPICNLTDEFKTG